MSYLTLWKTGKKLQPFFHGPIRGVLATQIKRMSSKEVEFDKDKPYKYLGTEAAQWLARKNRLGDSEDMPWFQPPVLTISIAVFLIYFCILREENDIDAELSKPLNNRIPGVEKHHLLTLHELYLDQGRDVQHIEARLKEILVEERKLALEKKNFLKP